VLHLAHVAAVQALVQPRGVNTIAHVSTCSTTRHNTHSRALRRFSTQQRSTRRSDEIAATAQQCSPA
jgi:hypothetical protein